MLYSLLNLTRSLSDADFEAAIDQVRTGRRAAREAVATERKMDEATRGISTRRGLEADAAASTPSDHRLLQQYMAAGLSCAEAEAHIRTLGREPLPVEYWDLIGRG